MKTKRLFIDTETTGLDKWVHGIHEIALLLEVDGVVVETFETKMKPAPGREIDEDALKVSGVTLKDLENYPEHCDAFEEIDDFLTECNEEYHPGMKMTMYGYSLDHDVSFTSMMFSDNSVRLGEHVNYNFIDVLQIARLLVAEGDKELCRQGNLRLESLCKVFKQPIKAHNAMSDIVATRELYYILHERLLKPNSRIKWK